MGGYSETETGKTELQNNGDGMKGDSLHMKNSGAATGGTNAAGSIRYRMYRELRNMGRENWTGWLRTGPFTVYIYACGNQP